MRIHTMNIMERAMKNTLSGCPGQKAFIATMLSLALSMAFYSHTAAEQVKQAKQAVDKSPLNDVQTLLFSTPHLSNITAQSQLHYDVTQTGSLTHALNDQIVLSITAINEDGGKDVRPQFLSGQKEKQFPAVRGFRGNPLLLYFLEWDVDKLHDNRTMNMNKVHRQYFQDIMRNAFSTQAKLETDVVSHNGVSLKVRRVYMQPMAALKNSPKYQHIWNKRYEFILADVPGGIYRITTEIPGDKPNVPPKERTEITFNRIVPADAARDASTRETSPQ